MKTYEANVIIQTLIIKANSEAEAEAKYNAYWSLSDSCPCGVDECECVVMVDEVTHTMEEIN